MANGVTGYSGAEQVLSNYEKYKDYFATNKNDEMGQDQFLMLMVEQMKNQDFLSPTDNSEYIAQMAQFSSVTQMQEMSYFTNATYATSLVGKTVVTGSVDANGDIISETGVVSSVKLNGKSFEIIVNGKSFTTANIMEVVDPNAQTKPETDEDKEQETEK